MDAFSNFDPADYLQSQEAQAAYLEATLDEAGMDPMLIKRALGQLAKAGNFSQLAREVNLSREGLYKALSDEGNPSFATVLNVASALGLRIRFQSAG